MTFDQFVQEIMEYESDTFSAQGSKITKAEATAVAENIIRNYVINIMDGIMLDMHLSEIRDLMMPNLNPIEVRRFIFGMQTAIKIAERYKGIDMANFIGEMEERIDTMNNISGYQQWLAKNKDE
jgi:hypothetical protein